MVSVCFCNRHDVVTMTPKKSKKTVCWRCGENNIIKSEVRKAKDILEGNLRSDVVSPEISELVGEALRGFKLGIKQGREDMMKELIDMSGEARQAGRDEVLEKIKSFKKTWCADNCFATVCHGCDLHEVFIEIKKKFGGKT